MKLIANVIGMLLLCLNLNAQNIVDQIFNQIGDMENNFHLKLSSNLLDMVDDDDEVLKDIQGLEIIILEDDNNIGIENYRSLLSKIKKSGMEELIEIRSKGDHFDFLFDADGIYLKDLIMIGRTDNETILFRFNGKIKKDKIGDIDIDMKGFDHLRKINKA